jgi:hypothetical protein
MDDRLPRNSLGAIPRSAIIVSDLPRRIVRRGSDYVYLVLTLGEPHRHLAGILANPRQLGSVVESVNKDSQTFLFSGVIAALSAFL